MQEVLKNLHLALSVFTQLSKLAEEVPIPPGKDALLVKLEPIAKDNAWRNTLMFPGSAYAKLEVKTPGNVPCMSPAELEAKGPVAVKVEGFYCAFTEIKGDLIFYAKAEKITPLGPPSGAVK